MKVYIFENTRDNRIRIIIEANSFTEAMDLLLSVIRDIDDFSLVITK